MRYLSNAEPVNPVYPLPASGICPFCGGVIATAATHHNGEALDACSDCGTLFDYDEEELR